MSKQTIVVLGGAVAGTAAAARAHEQNERAEVILFERRPRVTKAVCGLAFQLGGEVSSLSNLEADNHDVAGRVLIRTDTEIERISAKEHLLHVRSGGSEESVRYDKLIYAFGASSRIPTELGSAHNLVCFRTIEDLAVISSVLKHKPGARVAVLGGGPMGLEAADGLVRAGAKVSIIEKGQSLLGGTFSTRFGMAAGEELGKLAQVFTGTMVEHVERSSGAIAALTLSNGRRLAVDLVISAIGLSPRTELFQAAGGPVLADATIKIDSACCTELPDIYASGVCVSAPRVITGDPVWCAQAAFSDKAAYVAGINAAGGKAELPPLLNSMILRAGELYFARTGLTEAEAHAAFGKEGVALTVASAPSAEPYITGSTPVQLTLVSRLSDGAVLGAEAMGRSGVDKRIDVAATAIQGGLTMQQLATLELCFIPPLNSLRDPINVAAQAAAREATRGP